MQEARRDDVIEIDLLEVFGLLLSKAWLILLVAINRGKAKVAKKNEER